MTTHSLTFDLPPSLARELDSASGDFLAEILRRGLRSWRIEKALERYSAGNMSLGAAAHEAGVSQSEMARQAHARGFEPRYSERTVDEELD